MADASLLSFNKVIEMLVKYIDTTENSDFVVCLAGYRYLILKEDEIRKVTKRITHCVGT